LARFSRHSLLTITLYILYEKPQDAFKNGSSNGTPNYDLNQQQQNQMQMNPMMMGMMGMQGGQSPMNMMGGMGMPNMGQMGNMMPMGGMPMMGMGNMQHQEQQAPRDPGSNALNITDLHWVRVSWQRENGKLDFCLSVTEELLTYFRPPPSVYFR
jgi:hypothetical protein